MWVGVPLLPQIGKSMDSLKYAVNGIRVLDPNKIVILRPSSYKEEKITPKEKKLESLRYIRDKYNDKYGRFIIYALIALLGALVNAQFQGVSLILSYPVLIIVHLLLPISIYLIGVICLLYSKHLGKMINRLLESKPKRS